ncbi:MAG TPA: helix-turn-helix domain-containing protein [Polyangiales bacterium]
MSDAEDRPEPDPEIDAPEPEVMIDEAELTVDDADVLVDAPPMQGTLDVEQVAVPLEGKLAVPAESARERYQFGGVALKRTGQRPMRVIAISGAKGGAGKTVLSVNLAIYLSTLGRTTLVIDADRSGAHLHTLLGVPPLLPTQASCNAQLPALTIEPTSVQGLYFMNGQVADGNAGQARPRMRRDLFTALRDVDCDYLVLDLGAGIEDELLDAYLAADVALYVTVPEPAAVESTYRFVRALYLRRLLARAESDAQREELTGLAHELGGLPVPRELAEALDTDEHPLAAEAHRALLTQPVHFVVNQTRVRADLELGEGMRSAAWQRLGVPLDYLGYIDYDDTVWACVRERQPLLVKSPGTKASKNIEKLARRLISLDQGKPARRTLRPVPPGTHHDLLEVDRGATDEEVRRAYRRVRDIYAEDALCCYGLFDQKELTAAKARIEEAFDVLLDRARRRPYELSMFPDEPEQVAEESPEPRDRELPPAPPITPETEFDGALLRAVREARGFDLKQISKRTKISLAYLAAVEDDDFGALPALVYVRGFVAEMAKCLALDPVQVSHSYVRRVRRNLGEGHP